jgi:hypothetical protein
MQKVNILIDDEVVTEIIPMEFFDYELFEASEHMKEMYGAKTEGKLKFKIESVLTYIKNESVKEMLQNKSNNYEVTFFVD